MTLAFFLKLSLFIIGFEYAIVGGAFWWNGQAGMAVAYFAYAISNLGLILAVTGG